MGTRVPAAAEPKPLDHHRHPRHPQPALWATERASPASAPRSRRRWRSLTTARRRPARRRPSCCGSTPWWPATTSPLAIRVSRSSAVAFATASCCANWLTNSWNLRANLPSSSTRSECPPSWLAPTSKTSTRDATHTAWSRNSKCRLMISRGTQRTLRQCHQLPPLTWHAGQRQGTRLRSHLHRTSGQDNRHVNGQIILLLQRCHSALNATKSRDNMIPYLL